MRLHINEDMIDIGYRALVESSNRICDEHGQPHVVEPPPEQRVHLRTSIRDVLQAVAEAYLEGKV